MDRGPAEIAIVNDYEVVVRGVAAMLAPYRDQVRVVELDLNQPPSRPIDIALFDTFAAVQVGEGDVLANLLDRSPARRLVVYSWHFDPEVVRSTLYRGVSGYLSKALPGQELAHHLARINDGERMASPPPTDGRNGNGDGDGNGTGARTWPGRSLGLTERESELLALAVQGHGNADIARLMFLSPNSVKTHARNLYRKIGVSNRTQAVLWGIAHGFTPDRGALRTDPAAGAGMRRGGAAS